MTKSKMLGGIALGIVGLAAVASMRQSAVLALAPDQAARAAVTFTKDVAPILQEK